MTETEMDEFKDQVTRFKTIVRHIKNVQQNAEIIADKLVDAGEIDKARLLFTKVMEHDKSKLMSPLEWEHLHVGDEFLDLAHKQHIHTNDHHPEYWGGVNNMSELAIAEWVCDVKARSSEFGTDIWSWFKNEAPKKYNFSKTGKFYKTAKKYLDLLLEPAF